MKRPYRPSAVMVVAIMQITFGALGLLSNLCNVGIQAAGGTKAFTPPAGAAGPQTPDVEAMLRARVPHYDLFVYGQLTVSLIACTVMIVSGVGLLRLRPWARRVTIGYAFYNIAMTVFGVVFALLVTRPLMEDYFAQLRADPKLPPAAVPTLNMTEAIASVATFAPVVLLVYPIALLIIMFLSDVRAAFRGQEPAPDGEADEEGDAIGEEAPPGEGAGTPREDG